MEKLTRRNFIIQAAIAGASGAVSYNFVSAQPFGVIGSNDRVRFGVVGLGNQGIQQIEILSNLPNVEIAAVCDRDANKLGALKKSFDSNKKSIYAFSDSRRIFDLSDIDAVCLAVPLSQRDELVNSAISSEKDVLVDRQYSRSLTDAARIIDRSQKTGRIIGLQDRFQFVANGPVAMRSNLEEKQFSRVFGQFLLGTESSPDFKKNDMKSHKAFRSLPESAFGILDVGKNVLGAGMPSLVRTISGRQRKMFEFEFGGAGAKKMFLLETLQRSRASRAKTFLEFSSQRESFELSAEVSANNQVKEAGMMSFISGVRSRSLTDSLGGLTDAKQSIALLQLGNQAADLGKTIEFDPIREKIL